MLKWTHSSSRVAHTSIDRPAQESKVNMFKMLHDRFLLVGLHISAYIQLYARISITYIKIYHSFHCCTHQIQRILPIFQESFECNVVRSGMSNIFLTVIKSHYTSIANTHIKITVNFRYVQLQCMTDTQAFWARGPG